MPQATIIAAPTPTWDFRYNWPANVTGTIPGASASLFLFGQVNYGSAPQGSAPWGGGQTIAVDQGSVVSHGTGVGSLGTSFYLRQLDGYPWGPSGDAIWPSFSMAAVVWDFVLRFDTAVGNLGTGIWWCPRPIGPALATVPYRAATGSGGFGIAKDGAGAIKYLSVDAGGVLLDSVDLTPFIPAVGSYNTYRAIAVPGAAGARLTIQVNGVTAVSNKIFGSVTLKRPDELTPNGYGWNVCFAHEPAGQEFMASIQIRAGRLTPGGSAAEPE